MSLFTAFVSAAKRRVSALYTAIKDGLTSAPDAAKGGVRKVTETAKNKLVALHSKASPQIDWVKKHPWKTVGLTLGLLATVAFIGMFIYFEAAS